MRCCHTYYEYHNYIWQVSEQLSCGNTCHIWTHWLQGDLDTILSVIFKLILVIDGWDISFEPMLNWLSVDLAGDKSAFAQMMASSHQAPSHYLDSGNKDLQFHMVSLDHNKLKDII